MIETLLVPFQYGFMTSAIAVAALTGAVCAFLSAYLMLKGWSLVGDALSHAVVPGVAAAAMAGLPLALGAFLAAGLAALTMLMLGGRSGLKQDAIIGLVFTGFFGLGLFMISLNPLAISIQTITMGNILGIAPEDAWQLAAIGTVVLAVLLARWRDLLAVFFDEVHAASVGLRPRRLKVLFFLLVAAATVAAMQTVGAFLVVALLVTPGATAWLLTDRFPRLLAIAVALGAGSAGLGAYLSFFLDGATGGLIVVIQTLAFLGACLLAPRHGILSARRAGGGQT